MIVITPNYLETFAHMTLPETFVEAMKATVAGKFSTSSSSGLKLFECYCDISNIQFRYTTLPTKGFATIFQGFVGALNSTDFVAGTLVTRKYWVRTFTECLNELRREIPEMPDPIQLASDITTCKDIWVRQYQDYANLNHLAIRYWNSWKVTNLSGQTAYMALSSLWHSHGPDFTDMIHQGWVKMSTKRRTVRPTEMNKFVQFLVRNKDKWPAETFNDPVKLKNCFLAWIIEYFSKGAENNQKMLAMTWNTFMAHIESAYIATGIWPRPHTPLPRGIEQNGRASKTNIKTNRNKIEIQDQLLTEVPLLVTDDQALDIIFKKVNADINVVKAWATAQAEDLYHRASNRVKLAPLGQVRDLPKNAKPKNRRRTFEDHCASLEYFGLPKGDKEFKKFFGQSAKRTELAYRLGIPTDGSLFPYQCLLVTEHPKITPNFIYSLELYNERGEISGFLPTDTGYELIGHKDRRGRDLAEMKIELSARSAQWVREVIEITQPLRKALKQRGDDRWRLMFLTCGTAFENPSKTSHTCSVAQLKQTPSRADRLVKQFTPHTSLRGEELIEFIARVTPSRLRASCGVAVYIETGDVNKMSEALGHARHIPGLLSHYLPESILLFFQSRWVRIFQRGLICLAMKDSPYLLQATDFANMEELHLFLQNHAIKDIPDHLEDPERTNSQKQTSSEGVKDVYVAIGTGVLTALLSVEAAVNDAAQPDAVSGKARYWSEFTKVVVAEIERENDGLLLEHLAHARKHFNPARMEKLIYEAA